MEKNKKTIEHQTPSIKTEEDDIDLVVEFFNVIWKRKIFLIAFVFIITSSVTIYSLTLPHIYKAKVVILPTKPPSAGKITIFVGSEYNLIGRTFSDISVPEFFNEAEIKAKLNSKIFYKQLIKKYNLMPILFYEKWDEEQKKWKDPENPPTIDDGIRVLKKIVKVSENEENHTIIITVKFKDPNEAARLAELIVKELKNIMIKDTIQRAQKTLKELKKSLRSYTDPLIQQAIYPLIANQILTISLAKVSESFAFKVVDPPQVTECKPKRALMIVLAFVFSLSLGIFLVFLIEYIDNLRKIIKERKTDNKK